VVLLFGSIHQHFTFLQITNSYLFYLVLLLKITLFNTVMGITVMGKISRDCDKDVMSGKSWSSRRFLREFVG